MQEGPILFRLNICDNYFDVMTLALTCDLETQT